MLTPRFPTALKLTDGTKPSPRWVNEMTVYQFRSYRMLGCQSNCSVLWDVLLHLWTVQHLWPLCQELMKAALNLLRHTAKFHLETEVTEWELRSVLHIKQIRHSSGIWIVSKSGPRAQSHNAMPSTLQFSTSSCWTWPSCRWNWPCFWVLQQWIPRPSVILLTLGRWVSMLFGKDDKEPDKLSSCRESSPLKTAGLRLFSFRLLERSRTWRLWRPLKP